MMRRMTESSPATRLHRAAIVVALAATCLRAAAAEKPKVDPFGPPPVKWSDADRSSWRPAALNTIFSWYGAFVGAFPRSIVLPFQITYLDYPRAYTPEELRELMPAADWKAWIAPRLPKPASPTARASRVVFVNPPADVVDPGESHDLLGQAAAYSAALQTPFILGSGVRALVEYRWFNRERQSLDASQLPASLAIFIDREIKSIVDSLPEPQRSRVVGRKSTFRMPVSTASVIWVKASRQTLDIAVSPLLVRTLFIQRSDSCAPIQWKYRFPVEGPEAAQTGRNSLAWAEPVLITQCFDDFAAALDLPLAHELAHIFLSERPKERLYEGEDCPDTFAVNYMAAHVSKYALVIEGWRELLEGLNDPENAKYFGFGDEADDTRRIAQLRQLTTRLGTITGRETPASALAAALACVQAQSAAR